MLKKQGHAIKTNKVKVNGKTFARYTMAAAMILLAFPAMADDRCEDAYQDPIVRQLRESAIRTAERSERHRVEFNRSMEAMEAQTRAIRLQTTADAQLEVLRQQLEVLRKK